MRFAFAFFPLFGLSLHVNFETWLVETAQCGKILYTFELLLFNTHYPKIQKDGWAKYNPNFGFK